MGNLKDNKKTGDKVPFQEPEFPRMPRQPSQGHTYSNKPNEVKHTEKCTECNHLTFVDVGLFVRKRCIFFDAWIVTRWKSKILGTMQYQKKPDCQGFSEKAK